jgi:hypothetical protein
VQVNAVGHTCSCSSIFGANRIRTPLRMFTGNRGVPNDLQLGLFIKHVETQADVNSLVDFI